jgi:hypothetical protein
MPTIWLSGAAPSHSTKVTFSVNYSLIISIVALLFTIGSFWWINARRGKLKSFEPLSFAAMVHTDNSVFRFPLVLYNTGAKPIIVQNLRMRFPKETGVSVFGWRTMRSEIEPHAGEETYLPAGFSVPGRTAEQVFVELDGRFPNAAPEPRIYAAAIEAKLGHRKRWQSLVSFNLHIDHLTEPSKYVAYSNVPAVVSEEEKQEAKSKLQALTQLPDDSDRPGTGVEPGQ